MLHRNGTPPPSSTVQGRHAASAQRTEFPAERPANTARALIYHLSRQQLAGFPVIRWLYMLLVGTALLWPLLQPARGWWGAGLALLTAIALWLWHYFARRRSFVHFDPQPPPSVSPWPLSPSDKLPIYVSGILSVDGKARAFAALPAFYRTFATREHALLCQARPRRFAVVASWPADEEGLWYAFFSAQQVRRLRTGMVAFDRARLPGFVVDYQPVHSLDGKPKRRKLQPVTLYVAFSQIDDYYAALADLSVEFLAVASPSNSDR